MDDNTRNVLLGALGFAGIASLTWFFSSRPRQFLRVFGPPDKREFRVTAREILRDPQYQTGMRLSALLQFGMAAIFGLVGLCLWLRD